MKHMKIAAMLLLSFPCFASAQSPSPKTALAVVGTPDDYELAKQLFPDAKPNDLFIAAANDDDMVRIGVRGHDSTVQVTADGANVDGRFSINGIPFSLAAKAPTGPCAKPAFILSGDGLTFCDLASHSFVTR